MDSRHLRIAQREGVRTLVLDRPDVLNSFNARMAKELADALRHAAEDDDVRAIVLTGAGRAFCAGQDLAEVLPRDGAAAIDLGEVVERQYNPIVRAIRTTEKPFVCAVNGVAAGAGANIALACDIVIASQDATFIQSFSRIGLIPDSGGTFVLPRLVGLQRATALAMLGEKLTADTAKQWGLVYDVVPAGVLADRSFDLARRLAGMPTRALGLIKRGFNASAANSLEEQLALEVELQREAGRTADYAEGVAAFVEKRPAAYRGR
ncbi:MAG TPA: 2-(1,2-epoxy-1,2-dihydrophenyl)acetyl-CoA isomerase PaaG [Gemmatimonadaceae bacterium]|jgi:2-(1,2-epoxy-1,2-dihydrophenyl)acetyl-CoA isomerase|nr:2-(1,2-epoxy-1,2-dihydrophenyl)acetyl-CoA isomerase PaaG [Gemmatimonadaceae bacterium]